MTTAKRRRTWSAFGETRRVPSEYEVMTHETNWTLRAGRKVPFEQNPSSPANLWFLTYREGSPLKVDDWNAFRDPDQMTYRAYVGLQDDEETKAEGLLTQYAEAGADAGLSEGWVSVLGQLFTPARYPLHGAQQVQSYIGHPRTDDHDAPHRTSTWIMPASSTRHGNTDNEQVAGLRPAPLRASNSHRCREQVMTSPSKSPSSSAHSWCGQRLRNARTSPSTLTSRTEVPSTETAVISPSHNSSSSSAGTQLAVIPSALMSPRRRPHPDPRR
jgi:hypothetical protein